MRILSIRGKNLASLKGEFEVALNKAPLEQAGLFAITGHTGAGKSTLLDAMCLALFDKIPRLLGTAHVKVGRSDEDEKQRISSNDVGSIMSRGTASAYAEVEFIGLDKQYYQARWEIKRARNKVNGRLQNQSVKLINKTTDEIIGQNKSDTLEQISQRIGLNFEQFRRSVLLAQGDFAAFLKAKSDERSSLLERITGTEIYSQLSIAAYRQFQQEDQLLKRIQDKMSLVIPLPDNERNDLKIKIAELEDGLLESQTVIKNCRNILQWYEHKETLHEEYMVTQENLAALKTAKSRQEPLKEEIQKITSVQKLRPYVQQLDDLRKHYNDFVEQLNSAKNKSDSENHNEKKLSDSVIVTQEQLTASRQQYEKIKSILIQIRAIDTKIGLIEKSALSKQHERNKLSVSFNELERKKINIKEYHDKKNAIDVSLKKTNEQLNELQKKQKNTSLEKLNQDQNEFSLKHNELQQLKKIKEIFCDKESNSAQWRIQQAQDVLSLNELIQKADSFQDEYQQTLALCDDAKRALLIIQESVAKGAASLRRLLKKNQECPVCGSFEHPWAEQDAVLNQHYQQQKERVNELEVIMQTKLIELNEARQKIEYLKIEQLNHDKLIKQTAMELQELEEQWQTISRPYEFLEDINDSENDTQLEKAMEENNSAIKSNKEQIRYVIKLQNKIVEQQQKKDQLQNEERNIVSIITEQNVLLANINHLTLQLAAHQEELDNINQQLNMLVSERQTLFNEHLTALLREQASDKQVDNVDELERVLLDSINKLTEKSERGNRALGQSQKNIIKIKEQCHYLQQQIDDNSKQRTFHEGKLNAELDNYSLNLSELVLLLTKDDHWIKIKQDEITQLNNDLLKTETLLIERKAKLDSHEQKFQSFSQSLRKLSQDDLLQQLTHHNELLKITHTTQQEKLLEFKADEAKRQRIASYQLEFNTQQEHWNSWAVLNELIGSASGNKFRVFAQSLTLESLLSHANEHLNDFARRYQLQRVPATDLDLQIIDRDMADEVRSVQSLSGGESFLVSLALALGLASLSSTKTQVESLFIDEGFGTLDQETLDVAIASLDTLQGLGRKVGIISHVPLLVERIGTRVVVEKLGGGQSRVLVAS
ncbi:MAG: AAA family ATPase [gamma proteobacterium symbiont of Lucinoma myriamae]|nr:AAA family ATPase [gamma proteobacterium symbiont of Lucinoma myriamae]MCU7831690.1 AAA family ATPase [gamma proteobacterium symbiont of Lucinoma myriamae]